MTRETDKSQRTSVPDRIIEYLPSFSLKWSPSLCTVKYTQFCSQQDVEQGAVNYLTGGCVMEIVCNSFFSYSP